jgi:hypothetical protein
LQWFQPKTLKHGCVPHVLLLSNEERLQPLLLLSLPLPRSWRLHIHRLESMLVN